MNLDANELPHVIVGACMEVHRALGPGLPVEAYRECLARELRMRELVVDRDCPLRVWYKGEELKSSLTVDFVVEKMILVKVRAEEELKPIHKEEMINHLRLARMATGILVNFNVADLRHGIKRITVSNEKRVEHQA